MCRAMNKCFLVFINFILALTSVGSLGIGIWLFSQLKDSETTTEATGVLAKALHSLNSRLFILLFISSGCLGVFISLIGFFGAVRESRMALSVYTGAVSCLLITEIVGITLMAQNRAEIDGKMTEELLLAVKRDFIPYYMYQAKDASRSYVVSNIVNLIQISLKCCGVMNYTDYDDSAWRKASPTHNNAHMMVPASCCQISEEGAATIGKSKDWNNIHKHLVNDNNRCPIADAGIHKRGCLPVINQSISGQTAGFIIYSCVEIVVQLLCIASACYLMRKMRRSAFV